MNGSGNKAPEKILVFPFDLQSHYLRCIELARRYPAAEILFASSEKYDPFVQKAGYNSFKVEHFDAATVMRCAEKFDFSWLNKKDIGRVFLSQAGAIKTLGPQLVIGDTSPALKMAAEYNKVPYTVLMNGYMSRYYVHTRGLPCSHPGHGLLSKLPPMLRNSIIRLAEKLAFRGVHKPFRQLRKQYGLKPVPDYMREMEGDENLLCDEDFLFPQRALPLNYQLIGPLIYDTGEDEAELLKRISPEKKVILVCMGSSGNWEALRFLSSPRYSGFTIITAGDREGVIKGEHVIARSFVSLNRVLPHCALLICHGGNGTIYHGLRHKVPLLCLTSHFEQEWNVQRLEALHLGVWINSEPEAVFESYLERVTSSSVFRLDQEFYSPGS